MDQWGFVVVIIALVTFGVCVGTPLLKLNTNITRLNVILEVLQKQFDCERKTNAEEHNALWDNCEKHDAAINDHETRIQMIEHDGK